MISFQCLKIHCAVRVMFTASHEVKNYYTALRMVVCCDEESFLKNMKLAHALILITIIIHNSSIFPLLFCLIHGAICSID